MRLLAWIFIGIALFTIIQQGHNAGGQAAHLGGAALGVVLLVSHRRTGAYDGVSKYTTKN